ncbi:hypothetical protein DFH07DRAFT_300024 [Mycena maculata]|uniref:Uncharacterized protein n=1 Tax=Mycena maculata TaxID=230809 RepID=A0AAD7JNK2_9AGAR|nr:hypothetical protein DFH07DRAFT_300024 [Mycena maculata]
MSWQHHARFSLLRPCNRMAEPILPPELEREIFETVALAGTKSIPGLLRVARRVKLWIEPLLYHVVILRNHSRHKLHESYPGQKLFDKTGHTLLPPIALAGAIQRLPSESSFFHSHVRHLFIDCSAYKGSATLDLRRTNMLDACSGATNVMLVDICDPRPLLSGLSQMPLEHLQANLGSLFGNGLHPGPVDFTHPLFRSITHLAIFDNLDKAVTDWTGLALLPHLTHLSFHEDDPNPLFPAVLGACMRLRVLVILLGPYAGYDLSDDGAFAPLLRDERVVVVYDHKTYDGENDWHLGARGSDDYWRRAEKMVGERRLAGGT